MKRIVALTVALCFVTVSSAFAQSRAQARPDFSPKAAGITNVATPAPINAAFAKTSTTPKKAGTKSFWKGPWPYVIVAAVVVGIVVAKKGYDDTPGGGGY